MLEEGPTALRALGVSGNNFLVVSENIPAASAAETLIGADDFEAAVVLATSNVFGVQEVVVHFALVV